MCLLLYVMIASKPMQMTSLMKEFDIVVPHFCIRINALVKKGHHAVL